MRQTGSVVRPICRSSLFGPISVPQNHYILNYELLQARLDSSHILHINNSKILLDGKAADMV